MTNITAPGVTLHAKNHKGGHYSWQEPPMMGSEGWSADVMRNSRQGKSEVIKGRTRDEMIANAERYIDAAYTAYRDVEYIVRDMGDGRWEWFLPSLNFGGNTMSETSAIEASKKSIQSKLDER
jgi:hypothetical protein